MVETGIEIGLIVMGGLGGRRPVNTSRPFARAQMERGMEIEIAGRRCVWMGERLVVVVRHASAGMVGQIVVIERRMAADAETWPFAATTKHGEYEPFARYK